MTLSEMAFLSSCLALGYSYNLLCWFQIGICIEPGNFINYVVDEVLGPIYKIMVAFKDQVQISWKRKDYLKWRGLTSRLTKSVF